MPAEVEVEPGDDPTFFTVPSTTPGGPDFRVRADSLSDGGMLLVALPLDDAQETLDRLLVVEAIVIVVVLVAATGLGLWVVRVGLRPLRDIEATAERITEGDLTERVERAGDGTEVGRLGSALNTMLTQIEDSFDRQAATEERLRRFVADASHELRTPVAAVGAYAELFERGAGERPDDLDRVMRGIRSETRRMGVLVDDLLLLARLDEGRPLAHRPVDLVALTGEALATARALGPDWPVRMSATGPVEAVGDAMALRQVLDNLLTNVRVHTPAGTRTEVRIRQEGDDAILEVADDGPGLTPDDAARVFERFYRVDTSRSRERGGTGLGLAVVAAIAEAHGGRVELDTAPGAGATFRLRIPAASGPQDAEGAAGTIVG
jgi:two-component system OmpR family sensor kinase